MRIWRFLYDDDGHVLVLRLVPTIVGCVILAFFGTMLLFATTTISDVTAIQVTWALFALAGLKLPLIFLLWHFVARNREWPGRWTRWSRSESREILAYIEMEAAKAPYRPDARERLDYLSREAWHVADAVDGEAKVDALTVALRVDEARKAAT